MSCHRSMRQGLDVELGALVIAASVLEGAIGGLIAEDVS